MLKRFIFSVLLMSGALVVRAEVLDKQSSMSIEQDTVTGVWAMECASEVSGIDRALTYNFGLFVDGPTGVVFQAHFDLPASERSVSESVEGVYEYEAKMVGNKLVVNIDATWPTAGTNDDFTCVINIGKGPGPNPKGDTLHAMTYRHVVTDAGTP